MSRKRRRFYEYNEENNSRDECHEEHLDECRDMDPCEDPCDTRPVQSSFVFHTIEDHLPTRDRCPWFNPCGDDDPDDGPCRWDETNGYEETDEDDEDPDGYENNGYAESHRAVCNKKRPHKKEYCGYVELRRCNEDQDDCRKPKDSDKLLGKFKMVLCEESYRNDDIAPMGSNQKKHKQCKEFYGCIKLYREEKRRYGDEYDDGEEYAKGKRPERCEKYYGHFKLYPCERYSE